MLIFRHALMKMTDYQVGKGDFMGKVSEREIALFAFTDIIEDGGYNNIVLKRSFQREKGLLQHQKAFITEIVNGTLRNLILIDYIIGEFSKTPVKKIKPMILNILRISVYQMMFMEKTPHSAIVNEGVKLAKAKGYQGLSGYVNGVLRNVSRNKESISYPDFNKKPKEYLSIIYSYPVWLIEYFMTFMDNSSILEEFLTSLNKPAKVSICVNTLKISKEDLIDKLRKENMEVTEGALSPNALIISNTSDLQKSESFQKGYFHVMDQSSMAACLALAPEKGDTVLDLCAAPGGKTFYFSYIMENKGNIISNDMHPHKIALMEEGLKRLGIDIVKLNAADSGELNEDLIGKADCVILDAPCSGFGLIRKKPDIKYRKTKEDIDALVKIQRKLLDIAAQYVKIGGVLLYSTCTVSKMENEDNLNWFLDNYPYELGNMAEVMPGDMIEKINPVNKGFFQLLPNIHGTDGFFAARLIRKG